jgi:hypothetical protein
MARSIDTIIADMDAEQAAQTELSGLNSVSNSAIYTLWKYIVAAQMYLLEVLWDLFKADLETIVTNAAVGTNQWFKSKMLLFQYDATTPQVLQVDSNFAVNYTTIDATKRIVTRCAVKTTATRTVLIKLAKSEPPVALSAPELVAANAYVDDLAFAGINYIISSTASDKLLVDASIYYDGQYSAVISANVIISINTYLANIDFDGSFKLSALVDAIQTTTGVTDVVLNNVAIRPNSVAFASTTYLVQSKTTLIPVYPTNAGYVTEETTAGQTFTDKLNFIAQ